MGQVLRMLNGRMAIFVPLLGAGSADVRYSHPLLSPLDNAMCALHRQCTPRHWLQALCPSQLRLSHCNVGASFAPLGALLPSPGLRAGMLLPPIAELWQGQKHAAATSSMRAPCISYSWPQGWVQATEKQLPRFPPAMPAVSAVRPPTERQWLPPAPSMMSAIPLAGVLMRSLRSFGSCCPTHTCRHWHSFTPASACGCRSSWRLLGAQSSLVIVGMTAWLCPLLGCAAGKGMPVVGGKHDAAIQACVCSTCLTACVDGVQLLPDSMCRWCTVAA